MGKMAFVFSGQGAQKSGMGKSFYDYSDTAKKLFDDCNEIRNNTINQCFNGTVDELKMTINTQPCLYLTDLSAAIILKEKGFSPDAVAGFSLGEIPALAFANAYDYIDGFKLVCKRGEFMQQAAEDFPATMMAVIKLENSVVEGVCKKFNKVYPVNYNAPEQLVVAGDVNEMKEFQSAIKEVGGRCMPIGVGGGFHSPFLDNAAEKFKNELENIQLSKTTLPVYSNYKAVPYQFEETAKWLGLQMNNSLLWQKTIENMSEDGFDTFIEVGCGDTLKKLIKKILPDSKVYKFSTMEDLEDLKDLEDLNELKK